MKTSTFLFSNELQVKICGLTSAEDAQEAIRLGADALGFNFYHDSKRFVTLHGATNIISQLPRDEDVALIAVVVNPTLVDIVGIIKSGLWNAIQFHGSEAPAFCESFGFPLWIKAIRISSFEQASYLIHAYSTPYILLDTYASPDDPKEEDAHAEFFKVRKQSSYGGTGRLIDLALAARVVQAFPQKRFILAGGLRPENVEEAIQTVRPFAVDVASGVERNPGRKDFFRMRDFIRKARSLR